MANRTLKMYGKVFGNSADPATIIVHWAGQQIYSGTIATVTEPVDPQLTWPNMDQLMDWTIDTSVEGPTPLTITVENGTALFHVIHANYCGDITEKVGNVTTVITPSVDHWDDITGPSTEESDGYNNPTIDGILQPRPEITIEKLGKVNRVFYSGSTFECSVDVRPSKNVPA